MLTVSIYHPTRWRSVTALYKTDWGKRFRKRLVAAGKLTIGSMMRKLVHVAFGVLKSGESFRPELQNA